MTEIIQSFQKSFEEIQIGVADEQFMRVFINEKDVQLKVEFINDVAFYAGEKEKTSLFHLTDNWKNILTNKISALGRNEPKDIADILFICMKFSFNWIDVIELTKKKDIWVNEIEVSKIIHEFDIARLAKIKWAIKPDFQQMSLLKNVVAKEILEGGSNVS